VCRGGAGNGQPAEEITRAPPRAPFPPYAASCEKLGLAPRQNGENPGESAVAEVPVPIFSRPRHVAAAAHGKLLQVLYADDLNPEHRPVGRWTVSPRRLQDDRELVAFARGLGCRNPQPSRRVGPDSDRQAENWSLSRLAAADRNVLRMGIYEILFGGTPGRSRSTKRSSWLAGSARSNPPRSSTECSTECSATRPEETNDGIL
jgi:transcription antitermination protein NusB